MPRHSMAESMAEALAKRTFTPEQVADMQSARYHSVAHAQWREFVARAEDWLALHQAYEDYIGK